MLERSEYDRFDPVKLALVKFILLKSALDKSQLIQTLVLTNCTRCFLSKLKEIYEYKNKLMVIINNFMFYLW